MSFRHMHQDVQSERLLLVVLESSDFHNPEYRHIRATVVRRAVPHKLRADAPAIYDGTGVEVWNDDHPGKCFGYRVASYVFSRNKGTYVDDMQLRGQIDANPAYQPLNGGKPYGNEINFKPHSVCQNSARAILDFFNKRAKFLDKFGLSRRGDDFYVELNHLAQFLKITKVLFYKPGVRHTSLAETANFEETDIAFAKERIDEMLAPFARPVTE